MSLAQSHAKMLPNENFKEMYEKLIDFFLSKTVANYRDYMYMYYHCNSWTHNTSDHFT